jgi:hypothetical protein
MNSFSADLPANAKPSNYGNGWECERGFYKAGQKCSEVSIPLNAKLNFYGNGWECERGFYKAGQKCSEVSIPLNAKLNFYGNGWECSEGFRKLKENCIQMSAEEIIVIEKNKAALIQEYQKRKLQGVTGDDCKNEYKTNAQVCVKILDTNIDCQKNFDRTAYKYCDVTLKYEVKTDYSGGAYLNSEVECKVEIEYKGRDSYSKKYDSAEDDESHNLYAHGRDSESMSFNFTFRSYDEITTANISSASCEIDRVDLY